MNDFYHYVNCCIYDFYEEGQMREGREDWKAESEGEVLEEGQRGPLPHQLRVWGSL